MTPDPAILTIAIPTYNRAAKLQAQLERVVPQLASAARLCVYDNASSDDTREVVAKYPNVVYSCAATNCGGGWNFFRCFEGCQTEWLWILSDDDPVAATAVKGLQTILENQTADFIHTSTVGPAYAADTVVADFSGLFQHVSFTMLNWVSTGVYRVRSFRPFFRQYNESLSTWCPHSLMVLTLAESQNCKILLSSLNLFNAPGERAAWSTLDCIIRICHAPEYLTNPRHQQILAQSIYYEWFYTCMIVGLREVRKPGDIQKWKRIYRQASGNLKCYGGRGAFLDFLLNWHRRGRRRNAFFNLFRATRLELLAVCPGFLFHALIRVLPLPRQAREDYGRRHGYIPSV